MTANGGIFDICTANLGAAVTPQNSPPPANWQGQLQQIINQVEGQLQIAAGTIATDPARDRALVNLPQCYWLEGASNPNVTMTLPLAGQPGPGGQVVQYQFVVTATRSAVSWAFGDGSSSTTAAPQPCGAHDGLVAHKYTRISAESGGSYPVSVSETYTIVVTEYWQDSFGPHAQQLDLGLTPLTVHPPSIAVTVGQLEGVPQG